MRQPLNIGNWQVVAGSKRQLALPVGALATQTEVSLRLEVVHGAEEGPVVFVFSTTHGDEINGVDVVQNVMDSLSPEDVTGTVIGVPIVNVWGFLENTRYLPDGRDLNRSFPGSRAGSMASRHAHLIMKHIVDQCTHGIDLHTAAQGRYNHAHVRVDGDNEVATQMAQWFSAPYYYYNAGPKKSLRRTATDAGIPTLLFEGGEASRFDRYNIGVATRGVLNVLKGLSVIKGTLDVDAPPRRVYHPSWIRASRSGVVRLSVAPGAFVKKGQVLGNLGDVFQDDCTDFHAPADGYILSVVTYPIVVHGEALVHFARRSPES